MNFEEIKTKIFEEVTKESNKAVIKELSNYYDVDIDSDIYKYFFAVKKLDPEVFGETVIISDSKNSAKYSDYETEYLMIKYFVDHNVYVKLEGINSSYDDIRFYSKHVLKEVFPKEKVIIVYEENK